MAMKKSVKMLWGETQEIISNPFVEVHRIVAHKGMRCSMHKHDTKVNGFYVGRGCLRIVVEQGEFSEATMLHEGDYMEVAAGLYHRFEAVETSVAVEIYYPAFNHNDITRRDVGGKI